MGRPGLLGGRVINPAQLDPPIRRVFFTTVAVILGVALGIAFRSKFSQPVVVAEPGLDLPLAVALLAGALEVLAMALLLTGAAHARSRWRYLAAAPGIGAILAALAGPRMPTSRILYWLVGLCAGFYAARRRRPSAALSSARR